MYGTAILQPDGAPHHGAERLRRRRNAAAAADQVVAALREEVSRHFGKLSSQELDALAGWFNRNFFRLER